MKDLPINYLMLLISLLDKISESIKREGIKVFFWTINDPDVFPLLCRYVDGIITDDPELFHNLAERM